MGANLQFFKGMETIATGFNFEKKPNRILVLLNMFLSGESFYTFNIL